MLIIVEKKLHCMGAGRGDRALGKEGEWGARRSLGRGGAVNTNFSSLLSTVGEWDGATV